MNLDDVDAVAVLGAGTMGHGIAELAALAGYDVTLRDIEEPLVEEGYEQIEWSLNELAEKGQIGEADADAALDRVEPVVDLAAAVGDADVVIEAVPERMTVKRDVFGEVVEYAPERAVLASNTSSLSITELATATERPERVCGMHFFTPPVRMQLVEVVRGEETAEETLALIEALAESMGKTPIRVRKDTPGFVVNRVVVPLVNEAAWVVEEGDGTVATVDAAAKHGLGLPSGAFELADRSGIDVVFHVLEHLQDELGDAYEPCPLIEEKVEAGQLGKKTGAGFYDYDDGGVEIPDEAGGEAIQDRLLAIMANEVAALVDDDVVEPATLDRAVELGAGFPEGPARLAEEAGIPDLVETLDRLRERTGAERYAAAQSLRELAASDEGFYEAAARGVDAEFDTLLVDRDDGVGHVRLDRSHRLNTITPALLADLDDALDLLLGDDDARAILLTGSGDGAFSAGVDVESVADGADPVPTVELSRTGQRVFGRLRECDLPVVAGIDGYCLGGGMELATCADLRIASARSEFGHPELNFGWIPGWGGTQRLQRLVGEGRAKEIVLTGDRYDAETMADYGYVNSVVRGDRLPEAAMERARELAAGPQPAQRYAKRAMRVGWENAEAGLELEAQSFGQLVDTDDLRAGVAAFMSEDEPEFDGR